MIKPSSEASHGDPQHADCVCVCVCVCDECLIVSGEISDISGAETDNIFFLLIRGKRKVRDR